MERIKARKPIVAFLLSLLLPGLGQVYNGQLVRGIAFHAIILASLVVTGSSGAYHTFRCAVLAALFEWALQLSVVVDAVMGARRVREISLRPYNRWYYYAGACLLLSVILSSVAKPIWMTRIASFRTFKVPAASMEPALRVGDHFVAKLHAYQRQKPGRGDVIVFPYPEDTSKLFVKRIVGMEGEKLEIKDKKVFINDEPIDDLWAVHWDSRCIPKGDIPRDNFGPTIIPEGAVFVMGDNRDKSNDSRFWGYVQQKDIIGKALYVYWSEDVKRIGSKLN
jgi:signal peptidase I